MKPSLVLAFALGVHVLAQDKPSAGPADDLRAFRDAFAALPASGPTIAIVCRNGPEPIILTKGNDAGGSQLTTQSLAPLLGLAKVLAADAIAIKCKHEVDKGSGEKLGDRELSVRELLEGTTLLPDYFVLDGSDGVADAAMLRACGTMAVNAKLKLPASYLGAAEFVLLEPLALSGHHKDWQSMIRVTLAPHAGGVDPLSVDTLSETVQARLSLGAGDVAMLAKAQPALLRTVLTIRDLAAWWQWHSQQEVTPSASGRMGRLAAVPGRSDEKCWTFTCLALNSRVLGIHYLSQKAGLLLLSSPSTSSMAKVRQTFEEALFTTATDASARAAPQIAGAVVGLAPAAQSAAMLTGLAGMRWVKAPPAEGSNALRCEFGTKPDDPVVLTIGTEAASLHVQNTTGDAFMATAPDANGLRQAWLWPQPNAAEPRGLSVLVVTMRVSGRRTATAASSGPTSSVPQFAELVPAK